MIYLSSQINLLYSGNQQYIMRYWPIASVLRNLNLSLDPSLKDQISSAVNWLLDYQYHSNQNIIAIAAIVAQKKQLLAVDQKTVVSARISIQAFLSRVQFQQRPSHLSSILYFLTMWIGLSKDDKEINDLKRVQQKANKLKKILQLYKAYRKDFKNLYFVAFLPEDLYEHLLNIFWMGYLQEQMRNNIERCKNDQKNKLKHYLRHIFKVFFKFQHAPNLQILRFDDEQRFYEKFSKIQLQIFINQVFGHLTSPWRKNLEELKTILLMGYAEQCLVEYCIQLQRKYQQSEEAYISHTLFFSIDLLKAWDENTKKNLLFNLKTQSTPLDKFQNPQILLAQGKQRIIALSWVLKSSQAKNKHNTLQILTKILRDRFDEDLYQFTRFQEGFVRNFINKYQQSWNKKDKVKKRSNKIVAVFLHLLAPFLESMSQETELVFNSIAKLNSMLFISILLCFYAYKAPQICFKTCMKACEIGCKEVFLCIKWILEESVLGKQTHIRSYTIEMQKQLLMNVIWGQEIGRKLYHPFEVGTLQHLIMKKAQLHIDSMIRKMCGYDEQLIDRVNYILENIVRKENLYKLILLNSMNRVIMAATVVAVSELRNNGQIFHRDLENVVDIWRSQKHAFFEPLGFYQGQKCLKFLEFVTHIKDSYLQEEKNQMLDLLNQENADIE